MIRVLILMFWAASSGAALADLKDITDWLHTEKGLIGVAAGYADADTIIDVSTAGFRRIDQPDPVSDSDLWHVGSITKSMTALLLGTLVDRGELRLDSTLPNLFPEMTIDDGYAAVTLRDVLDHRGGFPANFDKSVAANIDIALEDRPKARATALAAILANPPEASEFTYSNVGYTLLGHIAEQHTQKTWEELISARVFTPLGLTSVGFGAPLGEQPWGHSSVFGMFKSAVDPTRPDADNTPLIGPAGTVHMSIRDFLRYGQELLRLSRGADGIVTQGTFDALFVQPGRAYSAGLVTGNDAHFGEAYFWHNGSNTLWYALLVVSPDTDRVIAITTNYFGPHFDEYVWEAAQRIAAL